MIQYFRPQIRIQTHLEDGQRRTIFSYPPGICLCDIPQTSGGHLLHLGSSTIVFDVLGQLSTANIGLTKITEEIPETKLQGNLVGVRRLANMLTDKGVIRII